MVSLFQGLLHYVTDKCGDACGCISREDKGRSLTSCPVKVIEIKGFQGKKKEMHMLTYEEEWTWFAFAFGWGWWQRYDAVMSGKSWFN